MSYGDYGITPEQYHAGLAKLWSALGDNKKSGEDIFTQCADIIKSLDNRMTKELNKGGYKVKNASYWKRQCNKLEEENAELRLSLIDIRSDLQNSNAMNVKLAYTNDELRAENAELRAQLAGKQHNHKECGK